MSPLIQAELLRLRTVRTPVLVLLGMLVVVASNAGVLGGHPSNHADLVSLLQGLASIGTTAAAAFAAYSVADGFQRGEIALSYVAHPRRAQVARAHALTYGLAGAALAAAATTTGLAIVLPIAAADHVHAGFSALTIAATIARAAFTGLVFGAIGALVATVLRNPTIAVGATVGWQLVESLITRGGTVAGTAGRYLPIQLIGPTIGLGGHVPPIAAAAALLAYLAVIGLVVFRWGLARDVT